MSSGTGAPGLRGLDFSLWHLVVEGELSRRIRERLAVALDPGEQEGWGPEAHPERTQERIVGRALLRACLGQALGQLPLTLPLVRDRAGKLQLGPTGEGRAHASLSHSDGHFVAAVTARWPVGVDVERLGRHPDRVAMRFFDLHEQALLAATPADQRDLAFYRMWTAKEACAKARGAGLGGVLTLAPVSLDPWGTYHGALWQRVEVHPDVAATVAVVLDDHEVEDGPIGLPPRGSEIPLREVPLQGEVVTTSVEELVTALG